MITNSSVVRWMRRLVMAVLTVCLVTGLVLGVESAVSAVEIPLPGTTWIHVGVVVLVLVLLLILAYRFDRAGFYWLLKLVNFEQLVDVQVRGKEYGEQVRDINSTLKRFNLGLKETQLVDIECAWPPHANDDVQKCCEEFARIHKHGLDAQVLELLYRGSRSESENTTRLWTNVSEQQRKKLAQILAESTELKGLDNTEQMVAAIEWVFERGIDYFDVGLVQTEIRALLSLWQQLKDYAGYLRHAGLSSVIPNLSSAAELERLRSDVAEKLNRNLLSKTEDANLVDLLTKRGKEWILAWDKGKSLSDEAADSLAVVSLGVFCAETIGIRSPLLPSLTSRVAGDDQALEVLFVHLWIKSKKNHKAKVRTSDYINLSELENWPALVGNAQAEMGTGITEEVCGRLRSELTNCHWLTWLPIHQANEKIVELYQRLESLKSDPVKDRAQIEEFQKELGVKISLKSSDLFEQIKAELDRKYAIPDHPPPGKVQDVKTQLDEVAATFRPETKLVGYMTRYQTVLDTLALFRERTADLTRQLTELNDEMEAEAIGGNAYLITFDQTRGALADLIDSLHPTYGFLPYTRYSRIGKLKSGKSFESFCREFEEDLGKLIRAAHDPGFSKRLIDVGETISADGDKVRKVISAITAARAINLKAPAWDQVEITIQQLNCIHRHDFIRDMKLPPIIRRDLRNPPLPEDSVRELGLPETLRL